MRKVLVRICPLFERNTLGIKQRSFGDGDWDVSIAQVSECVAKMMFYKDGTHVEYWFRRESSRAWVEERREGSAIFATSFVKNVRVRSSFCGETMVVMDS